MNKHSFSAAVLGASGYTGRELVRLLAAHPSIALHHATSESAAGARVPGAALRYVAAADVPLDQVDVVFTCLHAGESGAWAVRAHEAGAALVVDLSADLRAGQHGAVYGLPELWRSCYGSATVVANPGCYPTGLLLTVAPALRVDALEPGRPVLVDAASGVTGAGRTPRSDLLFGEVAEDFRPYGAGNTHRHVPEIAASLERLAGAPVPVVFTPHLLPVQRGILETLHLTVRPGLDAATLRAAAEEAYVDEPFVEVLEGDELPSLRAVAGRNVVQLAYRDVAGVPGQVVAFNAFDNLLKGAAGQALQNANLLLGLPEAQGLPR